MSVAFGVAVQWADWPPIGEVVLIVDQRRIRLDPQNASVLGQKLLEHAAIAADMTHEAEDPRLAEGIWTSRGGGTA